MLMMVNILAVLGVNQDQFVDGKNVPIINIATPNINPAIEKSVKLLRIRL